MRSFTLALALSVAAGCQAPCGFSSRCDGGVLETCVQTSATVKAVHQSEDCAAENAVCVVPSQGEARCVARCDQSFVTHCEGGALVSCDTSSGQGLVTAVDCNSQFPPFCDDFGCTCGGVCVDQGQGNAQCQPC